MDTEFPDTEPCAILALDIATLAGWAKLYRSGLVESGSSKFSPKPGQAPGYRFMKWQQWLEIQIVKVDYVAFELVKQPHQTRAAAHVYHGMSAILEAVCAKRGVRCIGYTVQDIKRAASGKGSASKETMISTAKKQWPDQKIADDNQADALWIMFLAARSIKLAAKFNEHNEELAF